MKKTLRALIFVLAVIIFIAVSAETANAGKECHMIKYDGSLTIKVNETSDEVFFRNTYVNGENCGLDYQALGFDLQNVVIPHDRKQHLIIERITTSIGKSSFYATCTMNMINICVNKRIKD